MKNIWLYGITGADQNYRVARYDCIEDGTANVIATVVHSADMMKIKYPSIERVYAVDDNHGLYRDYRDAFKKNSIESWVIFKDILEQSGSRVI